MANETIITVVGNVVADPEIRFTSNGAAVASFTVASTPRTFDRQANEWKDGEALFLRCSVWREAAENVAESLQKGMRVIVQGRLKARTYDDKDGNRRTSWELDVDEVGPALKFATAKVTRAQRNGNGGGWGAQQGGGAFGGGHVGGGGFGAPQGGGFGAHQAAGFGAPQGGQQGGGFGGPPAQGQQGAAFPPPSGPTRGKGAHDPWSGGAASGGGGWDTPAGGEPPF